MALTKNNLKEVRQRKYLGKDFDGLRALLVEYARQYHPDQLADFSENGIGGLFIDFAAFVGDNMSFYLDHSFNELDPTTAVELKNIERELRSAGVPITGASPSNVEVTFYVKVPAALEGTERVPQASAIPIIKAGSVCYGNGVRFETMEDIDFTERDGTTNALVASYRTGDIDRDGKPKTFIMSQTGLCLSGKTTSETFTIGSDFVAFKQITLSNPDVSEILSVVDSDGNNYYEVSSHACDVVYVNASNTAIDKTLVSDTIKVIPAPYRYTKVVDLTTRVTRLVLGGGNADSLEDDVIPDPSDFAVPFVYKKTFSRVALNPDQLLQTKTLGVYALNTTLTVTYRCGGGLSHCVDPGTIRDVSQMIVEFPQNPPVVTQAFVKNSVECSNALKALGGDDAPTVDDLKALVPTMRNMQERIVSKQDLIARVYTMPSNFGRVFRATVRPNPNNSMASQLYVISRDAQSRLVISPDTLKKNLITYLSTYNMISDAIEILDARRVNVQVNFEVLVNVSLNKSIVVQNVLKKLIELFDIKNYNIDQPIIMSDVSNAIYTTDGVVSLNELVITNVWGTYNNREYSDVSFDVSANTEKGVIVPPPGGIFEVRYPSVDIIGRAI